MMLVLNRVALTKHHSQLLAGQHTGSAAHLQGLVLAGIIGRLASPRARAL